MVLPIKARRPTNRELKRCLQQRHGCTVDERPIFSGSENEDGPILRRMLSPTGGFVPNLDDYPDDEEASPSTVDYFCRRLGLNPNDVHLNGPGGAVSVRAPSPKSAAETGEAD